MADWTGMQITDQQEVSDELHLLLQAIRKQTVFDHPVAEFRLIETHISCVLLTGPCAYKFKKPVDLGFLDFSSLARRKFYCEEEVRLNRRLAPKLYLGVVAFTGEPGRPSLNGDGPVLEYAVKMAQFADADQALYLLRDGRLTQRHIDDLAAQLASFHGSIGVAGAGGDFGAPETVRRDALENFHALRPMLRGQGNYELRLNELESWTNAACAGLREQFQARKSGGWIRECHGDLHLGNIALYDGAIMVFDCLEFSPALHWIDVINDLAFLIMDLQAHRRPDLAYRLLNHYLQGTGDYTGLCLLRFYLVYRALVRSKVAGIRLGQSSLTRRDQDQEFRQEHDYVDLALAYTRPPAPILIITHGLSGSGKSWFSSRLAERIGAIWLRSDVERKRLHGLQAAARSHSGLLAGIYDRSSTIRTYQRLADLSRMILGAGFPVIVDAAFPEKFTRDNFHAIADDCHAAFLILEFQADTEILKMRINRRQASQSDASEADAGILDFQIAHNEPLDKQESGCAFVLDGSRSDNLEPVVTALAALCTTSLHGSRNDCVVA
jgi:aminoglycoside phosphotransferase family enzyme/predicted kinase